MTATDCTERRRRAAAVCMIGMLATSASLTMKRADAHASGREPTPVYQASHGVKTPTPKNKVKMRTLPRLSQTGPDPDLDRDPGRQLEPVACTISLCGDEVRHLREILRQSAAGDLDLIEDTLHQTELVDGDAVARAALAVRLEVALG